MAEDHNYAEVLRSVALRVTRPRMAVLHAVGENPHADTEVVIDAARAVLPEVSRQTIYDVLNALTAAGLVRRIQPAGSLVRYETRVGDNHHHIVCRSCGAITDVDCTVGDAPCLIPANADSSLAGFDIDEAEVIYWATCPECASRDVRHS